MESGVKRIGGVGVELREGVERVELRQWLGRVKRVGLRES